MISFSGVWVKIADVAPTISAFYRVLFGGLFLLAAACWKKEIIWDVLLFQRATSTVNWIGVTIAITGIYLGMNKKSD